MRRISKQRNRVKKILDVLEKGRTTFEILLAEVKCGRITLSNDLKMLVHRKVIKKYEDSKDARVKWYEKIVAGPDDRVKAVKGKYAALDFIENLQTPVYWFEPSKDGKTTISVFLSPVEEQYRQSAQKLAKETAKRYAKVYRLMGGKIPPGRKMAVVLTLAG